MYCLVPNASDLVVRRIGGKLGRGKRSSPYLRDLSPAMITELFGDEHTLSIFPEHISALLRNVLTENKCDWKTSTIYASSATALPRLEAMACRRAGRHFAVISMPSLRHRLSSDSALEHDSGVPL